MKLSDMRLKDNLNNIGILTMRNVKLFIKNKTTVFFSLLAPILIFIVFVAFMSDIQIDLISGLLPAGDVLDESIIVQIVNAWMIAGIMGITCLTVGLNATLPIVQDKENRATDDFTASPISSTNLLISYLLGAFLITFTIAFIVLIISLSYLWLVTGVGFTFALLAELVGILFLSALSSVMIMMCVMSFFKNNQSSTAFTGVYTALIGFFVGAYMPLDFLPTPVQNIATLIPGTHSVGLFRNAFLGNILGSLEGYVNPGFIDQIKEVYSMNLSFFGYQINRTGMFAVLAFSIILFFGVYLIIDNIKRRRLYIGKS